MPFKKKVDKKLDKDDFFYFVKEIQIKALLRQMKKCTLFKSNLK